MVRGYSGNGGAGKVFHGDRVKDFLCNLPAKMVFNSLA
jgi:hypothetical protein